MKKPTKKRIAKKKRKNPESMVQIGYEDGKYDWEHDQYFSVGESYINTVKSLLEKEGYSPKLNDMKGYIQGYYYVAYKAGKLPIEQYRKIVETTDEDGLLTEFTKIIFIIHEDGPMTTEELGFARNEGKPYAEFIINGLASLGYVKKASNKKWILTDKGTRALSHIVHANKIDDPASFKDISYFLRRTNKTIN